MAHILLPTDFSDAALNAVRFAIDRFGGMDARFTLLHVYQPMENEHALVPGISGLAYDQAALSMREFEAKCNALHGSTGFSRIVAAGWLPAFLKAIAVEQRADMIVMGLHGGGNALIGTMATAVIKSTRIPVLLVPREWSPVNISRVLLAHDGRSIDRATLDPLVSLAARTSAQIIVAHVRNTIPTLDEPMDREMIARSLPGVQHTFVTVQGETVANTIDELARTSKIQLVAAIHRKRGFWQGLLHRSRTRRMALHTHVPLMVLPEELPARKG